MNCKNVEELLPLYVGRDLEENRARLVTSHLQACTECSRSVQEYGEANQLLQLFGPPQFSEATYTAVRSRVLREIERESNKPQSMFALEYLQSLFQPRIMWAVSTAVLLAVCLFAYYFIANRANGRPYEQANAGTQHGRATPSPGLSGNDRKPDPTGTAGVPPASRASSLNSRLNLTAQNQTAAGPPASETRSPKPRLNQTVWHSQRAGGSSTPAGLPGWGPHTPAVPVRAALYSPAGGSKDDPTNIQAASDKTLRLEIQTSNPNIRIIWFSQPANNQGSPNESSKGI